MGDPHVVGYGALRIRVDPSGHRVGATFRGGGDGLRVERDEHGRRVGTPSDLLGVESDSDPADFGRVLSGRFAVMPVVAFRFGPLERVSGDGRVALQDFQIAFPPAFIGVPVVLDGRGGAFGLLPGHFSGEHGQTGGDLRVLGHHVSQIGMVDVGPALRVGERQVLLVEHGPGRRVGALQSLAEHRDNARRGRFGTFDDGAGPVVVRVRVTDARARVPAVGAFVPSDVPARLAALAHVQERVAIILPDGEDGLVGREVDVVIEGPALLQVFERVRIGGDRPFEVHVAAGTAGHGHLAVLDFQGFSSGGPRGALGERGHVHFRGPRDQRGSALRACIAGVGQRVGSDRETAGRVLSLLPVGPTLVRVPASVRVAAVVDDQVRGRRGHHGQLVRPVRGGSAVRAFASDGDPRDLLRFGDAARVLGLQVERLGHGLHAARGNRVRAGTVAVAFRGDELAGLAEASAIRGLQEGRLG